MRPGLEAAPVPTTSPLDRKDALTKRPLDFDQEEETRKVETSKWLENHFGSDSRSSNNSIIDEEEEFKPKTGFFNVTIKSQPTRMEQPVKSYVSTVRNNTQSAFEQHQMEPERDRNYFQGTLFSDEFSDNLDFIFRCYRLVGTSQISSQ